MTHKGLLQPGDLDSAYSKESSQVLITKMEAASTSWKYFKIPVIVMSLALMIGFVGNTMYSLQMNALRDTMLLIMDILVKSAIVTTAFWSALGIHFIVTQRKATEFNTKLMLFVIAVALGIAGVVLFGFSINQVMYHVQERNQTEIVPNLIKAVIGLGMLLSGLIIIGIYEFLSSREMKVKQITAFSKKDNHPNGSKLNKIFAINNDSISNKNDDWRVYTFNISTDSVESETKNAMDFILQKLSEQNLSRDNLRKVSTFFKNNNFYVTQFPDTPPEVFPQAVKTLYSWLQTLGRNEQNEMSPDSRITLNDFFTHPRLRELFNLDYDKRIDAEIYNKKTMELIIDIDEKSFTMKEFYKYINDSNYIIHIYDISRPLTSGIQKGNIQTDFWDIENKLALQQLDDLLEPYENIKSDQEITAEKDRVTKLIDEGKLESYSLKYDSSEEVYNAKLMRNFNYPYDPQPNSTRYFNFKTKNFVDSGSINIGRKVFAYANIVTKNDEKYYIYFLSGDKEEPAGQIFKYEYLENALSGNPGLQPIFDNIPGGGTNDRKADAERKILMALALNKSANIWSTAQSNDTGANFDPKDIKEICLFTERAPCPSCRRIIYRFVEYFKDIEKFEVYFIYYQSYDSPGKKGTSQFLLQMQKYFGAKNPKPLKMNFKTMKLDTPSIYKIYDFEIVDFPSLKGITHILNVKDPNVLANFERLSFYRISLNS